MKIVVLDGYAANPGDISWEPWKNLTDSGGKKVDFVLYDRTAPEELMERAEGADMLLTNKVVMTAETINALPELKYIGVLATGFNIIDTKAAHDKGVVVTNIPAYSTASVAQLVFAHLLNIAQNPEGHSMGVHQGRWQNSKDFTYWDTPLIELAGLTLGIVGLGNTGSATARIAQSFGMNVVAYTSKAADQLPEGIAKAASLEELFKTADVLSLHCPLTPDTKHLVNAERLAMMKPSAIVINTGRGPLVDEQALADALSAGTIYAAAVDVLTQEPPRDGSPLIGNPKCHITPHIAWASVAARQRLDQIALANVKAFLAGAPQNMV